MVLPFYMREREREKERERKRERERVSNIKTQLVYQTYMISMIDKIQSQPMLFIGGNEISHYNISLM
jgi:hypothetical protein